MSEGTRTDIIVLGTGSSNKDLLNQMQEAIRRLESKPVQPAIDYLLLPSSIAHQLDSVNVMDIGKCLGMPASMFGIPVKTYIDDRLRTVTREKRWKRLNRPDKIKVKTIHLPPVAYAVKREVMSYESMFREPFANPIAQYSLSALLQGDVS